jgi:hypothetical protein
MVVVLVENCTGTGWFVSTRFAAVALVVDGGKQ